ncbi:hypothetical protein VNI00_002027 [Paramarasmius palmivorus]|uniref:Uncharacterized protein n=1 Tax=Paramarasmius palmivorus TaxID=297713 RepID=A0AAW0E2K1_9AGAR
MCLVPHYYKDIRIPPEFFVDDEPVYRPGDCILTNISAPYVLRQQALQLGIDSLTLLARNGKIRPGTVIAVPSESSIYYTICLMATFGDTEYENLEDKLLKHFSVKVLTFDDKPDENTPRIGTTPMWEHYPQHLIAIPVKCTKEELIAPCFSSRVDHRGFRVPFRFESDAREAILKCALTRRRDWNVDLRDPVKKQAWAEEYVESQVEQRALKKRDEQVRTLLPPSHIMTTSDAFIHRLLNNAVHLRADMKVQSARNSMVIDTIRIITLSARNIGRSQYPNLDR